MNQKTAKALLLVLERIRGEPVDLYLRELMKNEKMSLDQLRELQWRKFVEILNHAYENSPFYRQSFDRADVHPSDIRSPADVGKIPVLTKEDFQKNAAGMLIDKPPRLKTLAKTSGSTGDPLKFYKDRKASGYALAAMYRGHRWHGLDIGAKEAMLWGVPVNFGERQMSRVRDSLLNRFREKEYNLKAHVLRDFYNSLIRKKPAYLMGYSSMVYEFARFLQEEKLDGRCLGLRFVKCTSETIQETYRETIREVFGCSIVSEYGAAETGLIAFECDRGNHHLMLDCVYINFVEQDLQVDGEPTAKLLITDLHNHAVPVINYEIGDTAVASKLTCPCGRPFPLLKRIIGRVGDVVYTPDGQRLHSIIFYYIMKGLAGKGGGIKSFKVYQKTQDQLKVMLVTNDNFSEQSLEILRKEFERHFGPRMQVDFEFLDHIPRERSGKLRDFVQEMDTDHLNGRRPLTGADIRNNED